MGDGSKAGSKSRLRSDLDLEQRQFLLDTLQSLICALILENR